MTENQAKQMMKLMNNCISGINELREGQNELREGQARLEADVAELKADMVEVKSDVAELKSDVAELKDGQRRIESTLGLNDRVINALTGEQYRIKERLLDLEQPQA